MDILIVEDDELTHKALITLTRRMGLEPRGATNTVEALSAVKTKAPEVLLTDWDLGDEYSGIDVAYFTLQHNKRCKIIFCTGNCIDTLKRQTRHINGCRFMQKPLSLQQFRETLTDVLSDD